MSQPKTSSNYRIRLGDVTADALGFTWGRSAESGRTLRVDKPIDTKLSPVIAGAVGTGAPIGDIEMDVIDPVGGVAATIRAVGATVVSVSMSARPDGGREEETILLACSSLIKSAPDLEQVAL